ncbi:hypothetical protein HHL17_12270 [Chitinophaga sp. G-6-1-13]|uniref:Tetratricopeptide repeat protein n=1 Tax=Chitinophaga fulva TaxID=2728842 RepID=A0A848GJW7_9BACT|nr:hypothetical protein [Chitinophaga fulva]NML37971.1 hypothetical protein [Chitinophaga fulva]
MIANTIIAHVFLQASLHKVDVAAMDKLVAEYPYFSAARLLLARKVYHQHGDLHDPAIKKAMLYSGQPHHFYHIVTHEPVLETVEDRVPPAIPVDALPDDLPAAPAAEENLTEEMPVAITENGQTAAETEEETDIPVALEAKMMEEETEKEVKEEVEEAHTIAAPVAIPVMAEETPVMEAAAEMPAATAVNGTANYESADPDAILAEIPEQADMVAAPETDRTPHQAATEEASDHAESTDVLPIKIFPLELSMTEETTLTFQPLYTDDYFAYKRLKDPEQADELSAQGEAEMKSFTSWLRQIKDNFSGRTSKDWYHQQLHRLYQDDEEPEVSETVEKMAMDSITFNNDIVSETLADIWVRQRQYQQAIRIYQKLSLLNPDKNAYFAQKIQELKSLIDKSKH